MKDTNNSMTDDDARELLGDLLEAAEAGAIEFCPVDDLKDLSFGCSEDMKVRDHKAELGKYIITTEVGVDSIGRGNTPFLRVKIKRKADKAEVNIIPKNYSVLVECPKILKGFSVLIFILQIHDMVKQGLVAEKSASEQEKIRVGLEEKLDKIME